ncbi:MAG: nitrilase-related carbon-nitrogen hydrolase, partial [Haliea sp.]
CFGAVVGPDAVAFSAEVINDIAMACGRSPQLVVATSLVLQHADSVTHCAVLLNHQGLIFCQPQIHATERHCWSALGDNLQTLQLPWGKVAVLTADDVAYPELVKVAALQGVHVLIAPIQIQELWETQYGLPSRAAENRICVLASSRVLADGTGTGMIATLEREFTIMTPWRQRQFDGNINSPMITCQRTGLTVATVHPHRASNKLISANTDLLQGRPWHLCADLVATEPLVCQRSGS